MLGRSIRDAVVREPMKSLVFRDGAAFYSVKKRCKLEKTTYKTIEPRNSHLRVTNYSRPRPVKPLRWLRSLPTAVAIDTIADPGLA